MQRWNGDKPSIKPLLAEFYIYLADSKIKAIRRNRKPRRHSVHYENNHNHKIGWIETLLQIPISDHRKNAVRTILAPYLLNIRKLSHEDATIVIREWLDKCDKLCPLVGVNTKIKSYLGTAARVGYLPKGFSDLKIENRQLTDLISSQMNNHIPKPKTAD